MAKRTSTVDALFEELYGRLPAKAGTALELLFAAAVKLADAGLGVRHDARATGSHSGTGYQLEVTISHSDAVWAAEAKDYTQKGKRVGRDDLQKFVGALLDLKVEGGAFVSATGYTKPAESYASAAESIAGKAIQLFHLRQADQADGEGRIRTVVVNVSVHVLAFDRGVYTPVPTEEGVRRLLREAERSGTAKFMLRLGEVLDAEGNVPTTVSELTRQTLWSAWNGNAQGSFPLSGGHIEVGSELIPLHGITYDIPFNVDHLENCVDSQGTPSVVFQRHGEEPLLLTDVQLRRVHLRMMDLSRSRLRPPNKGDEAGRGRRHRSRFGIPLAPGSLSPRRSALLKPRHHAGSRLRYDRNRLCPAPATGSAHRDASHRSLGIPALDFERWCRGGLV